MSSSDPGASADRAGASALVSASMSGWRWLPLSVIVILLDQLTKAWVVRVLDYAENIPVLPVLNITLRYNPGAAFSFLAGASGWQRWFFIALAVGVSVALVIWLRRLNTRAQPLLACSLSLILAGAIGNVIDRVRLGHVVDFIHVYWRDWDFPAFNVADSAITIGAVLMLFDAFRESRRGGQS